MKEWLEQGQLPALPELYLRCLEQLRDPGFAFAALSALMKQEQRLMLHVVRRSNSDGRGRGTATTADQAIGRLGALGVRTAVVELGSPAHHRRAPRTDGR